MRGTATKLTDRLKHAAHPAAEGRADVNENDNLNFRSRSPARFSAPDAWPSYIIGWVSHVARACAALHHKLLNTFADSSQNLLYPYRLVLRHCCPRRLFDHVLPEPLHVHVYVPLGWQRSRRAYQARSAAAR
jgi:hypothetical protein